MAVFLTRNSGNIYRGSILCFFAAFLIYSPAYANIQEEPDYLELSPQQLFSATVISATKTSETWWDSPSAVYVLTNEDIKRSGATSIPEALRMVPGVQVARINSSNWAVSVRGFNNDLANKLLVLIDGREVYDHLFSGVYWDVVDNVQEDIERIEVIRGPGGTLWGANAVNGVINIITKKAKDTQGGMVSTLVGNQDRNITSARYGGKIGEDGNYRVYGKYLNRDENELVSGANAQDDWNSKRGGFRMDFERPEEKENITLQGEFYQSDSDQLRIAPDVSLQLENIESLGGNMLGRYEYAPKQDEKFTLQSYFDYTFRDQYLLKDKRASFDIDAQYEFAAAGMHKFIVGGRYRYSDDSLTGSPFITFDDSRENDQSISSFVQDKITLSPEELFLTLGSKIEYNNYTGLELQPSARLQWHPDNEQILWAAISRAVRTPNRLEHDLTVLQLVAGGVPVVGTVGNQNFDSETMIAYELGYRHNWQDELMLDVSAFYNDYDDLLTYDFTGTPPAILTFTPTNNMTASAYGMEAVMDWRASNKMNLIAAYSIMQLELHNDAAIPLPGPESAEGRSPQQQFNLRAPWDITSSVQLDPAIYYVDSLPNYNIKNYWRFDLRLGWQVTDGVTFDLVGQDLFSNGHREFFTTDPVGVRAERIEPSIYGRMTWRF